MGAIDPKTQWPFAALQIKNNAGVKTAQKVKNDHPADDQHLSTDVTPDYDNYKFEPLDSSPGSIRLLHILPETSPTGLVQCQLQRGTTDAPYRCMSYVWGPSGQERTILVNRKKFRCRTNLFHFLDSARLLPNIESQAFWVDAICINQDNLSERNEQVAQMGDIYRQATGVLAWFGLDGSTTDLFNHALQISARKRDRTSKTRVFSTEDFKNLTERCGAFWRNEYWSRAWITQEIFLAKSIRILARDTEIGLDEFEYVAQTFPSTRHVMHACLQRTFCAMDISKTDIYEATAAYQRSRAGNGPGLPHLLIKKYRASLRQIESVLESLECADAARMQETYMRSMSGQRKFHLEGSSVNLRWGLIHLFHALPFRYCVQPRDQIYSLRAIAKNGPQIRVDYGISDYEVLVGVCKVLADAKSLCICTLAYLRKLLKPIARLLQGEDRPIVMVTMSTTPSSTLEKACSWNAGITASPTVLSLGHGRKVEVAKFQVEQPNRREKWRAGMGVAHVRLDDMIRVMSQVEGYHGGICDQALKGSAGLEVH
jgi:hypothetical protein